MTHHDECPVNRGYEACACDGYRDRDALRAELESVTAHRDRLRDMLNDVRGMIFADQPDLVVRIMRRIDPVEGM